MDIQTAPGSANTPQTFSVSFIALRWTENTVLLTVLAGLTVLPLFELAGREGVGQGLSGSISIVQHLTLWITFLGAALAARGDRMLAMSTASFLPEHVRGPVRTVTYGIAIAIVGALVWASIELVLIDHEYGAIVAWGIPVWVVSLVMPVCLTLVCIHHVWHASPKRVNRVLVSMALLIVGGLILGPIVQRFAFGAYWTGWPFGHDLTDNKTLIAFLAWLPASVLAWRGAKTKIAVALGWVVMMGIFLIPHSVRGSQLDWSQLDRESTVASE